MEKCSFYLFSLAAFKEEANELYAEYHLGRLAFRLCKQVQRSALVPLHLHSIQGGG
jgi:hypothetical protein